MKIPPEIATLVPYVAGKPIEETQREYQLQKVIKLASNENPIGASPLVQAELKNLASILHLYPDAASVELTQAYARKFNFETSQLVFGNGSNELIDLLLELLCAPGDWVLTSQKAFIAYQISAQAHRLKVHQTPLTSDYRFDLKAMADWLESTEGKLCRLVFLANPNNPTGTYFSKNEFEDFLKRVKQPDRFIVLDEAYAEYAQAQDYPNGLEYVKSHPEVVVLRTFSKIYGLAGLRLGVLIASEELVSYLHRIRNPFNISILAQRLALVALKDDRHVATSRLLVTSGMEDMKAGLKALGLTFLPSQANFLLVDCKRPAAPIYEGLLRRGVIVRPVANYGWPQFLRITIGTIEENQKFLQALAEALKA